MSSISHNLQAVRDRIATAEKAAGRAADEVGLLAVSKTFDAAAVLEVAEAGQRRFGENYLQEALDKMAEVSRLRPGLLLEWHFIGPIQSNKTRLIAEHFDWVHSVDRFKIAQRLSDQRPESLPPLNICLQVNISGEASKSGVPPREAIALAMQVAALPRLRLRGLMTIPEPAATEERQRGPLRALRLLAADMRERGIALDTLSMGMSNDLEAAVAEGATLVRIGTAIFGKRNYAH
ncbi:MAG TPA: YggS family pyridoxal phosphate-dependent enzyme [Noviherbaspirillum sp.]|jgi:pyridoxal phosphate enzyme (YggS family)|uniref:YggS family pyridoxal phosphate-dependent enzyme n=1 Tax=Noviherbaspirillum sp. TaxID=1926288 RepID=UPI002F949BD0